MCPTLCKPMDCNLPGSSVHSSPKGAKADATSHLNGQALNSYLSLPLHFICQSKSQVLQARILEWVAIPFSRGSSWPGDWTFISCTPDRFLTIWPPGNQLYVYRNPLPPGLPSNQTSPSHPPRSPQSTELSSLCYTAGSHWLSILHMTAYRCQSQSPSSCPHNAHMPIFSLCISVPALQMGSSVAFSRFHVWGSLENVQLMLIYNVCFSLHQAGGFIQRLQHCATLFWNAIK